MSSGTESTGDNSTYADNYSLNGSISQEVTRKDDNKIHTRVMVEDPSSPGYKIDTAKIIDATYVSAFNADIFLQKLLATYPAYASNQFFVEKIYTIQDSDTGKMALRTVAAQAGTGASELKDITEYYDPDDPAFIALAAEWGITFGLGYGYIVYYTDPNHTQTDILQIRTQDELSSLSPGESATTAWLARIGGKNIPNQDIYGVVLSKKVATISKNFLYGCGNIEYARLNNTAVTVIPDNFCKDSGIKNIILPNSEFQIGENFAYGCNLLTSVSNVAQATAIGTNFMYGCSAINMSFSFTHLAYTSPSETKNDFTGWFHNAAQMCGTLTFSVLEDATTWTSSDTAFSTVNSSQPIYTTGITIKGAMRATIRNHYPDLSGPTQYRKTIDGGS